MSAAGTRVMTDDTAAESVNGPQVPRPQLELTAMSTARSAVSAFWASAACRTATNVGMAIPVRIPTIDVAIKSSIKVNPRRDAALISCAPEST